MAKKITPKKFLSEIGTDPDKLGSFIIDPEAVMDEYGILKKDRHEIKCAVSQAVHKKLCVAPDAYICLIV
jgi:hypothetical protein